MEKISKIQISVIQKIPKGKLEEFKQLAAEHIRGIRERDTGTLKFDIFLSSDQTEGETRVVFKNSEAVLEHMANHGLGSEKFMSFIDHVNVYGEPSPKLLEAGKKYDLKVYSLSQGLEEMIEV